MLLVMTTIAQLKPRPKTPLPIKNAKADTTIKTTQKTATQTPVILSNPNVKIVDPKLLQTNQPAIGNKNIQQQKEINKAAEEIKNTPQKVTILEAKPILGNVFAVVPKTYKLKITTTDVECIKKSNKHPLEEYRIFQTISYVSEGKTKVPNEFSSKGKIQKPLVFDAVKGGYFRQAERVKNDEFSNLRKFLYKDIPATSYVLIDNINNRNAIPFKAGLNSRGASKNIDHTFIYTITESDMNDPTAKMVIHTTLGEYSGRKNLDYYSLLVFDLESPLLEVSIKDVLAILTGKRPLNANKQYLDPDIAKGIMFDAFDGFKLYLSKVNYPNNIVLEGPIRKRTASGKEKAAVWMRFELIE